MSVRSKAILIISLINLLIILFSVFSGILYVRTSINKNIEMDMMVVADIADHFISAELEFLKFKAGIIAVSLADAGEARWSGVLDRLRPQYPQFIGMAVLTKDRVVASAGEYPAYPELIDEEFVQHAFLGNTVISSTYPYPAGDGVMFYLGVSVSPADVLVLTLPGMYFSDHLSSFTIWETGHIFIDDAEGYVIANIRSEWVQNRFNFIRMSENDSGYLGMAAAVSQMIRGETGIARFSVSGIPRICAFRPVTCSDEGWSLGVVAPLPESPFRNVGKGLQLVGLISIFLGTIAAVIASKSINKPFEEAAALRQTAESNSESKSRFLANMSHEMRTPLNAVIGLSGLTLDGKIDGEEKENIQKVYTAGVTLLGIINDILDISKIEAGKFELNPVEYEIPSVINDVITMNIMRIEEKPVAFKLFIDEDLPATLYGDDLRVRQVFSNILSNAFKYTKAGIVEWHLLWEKSGNDIWLISSFRDSGIGIRPEDQAKLFENYTQLETSANRKIEGTGLGLPLTKYLVEMMGGNIIVDSEYGKGSTFTIRIRQGFVSDVVIGPAVAESLRSFKYIDNKQERNSGMTRLHLPYARVLVVDDVPTNLAVVKGILKPYGMQVDGVASGPEAIELIRNDVRYNAIFMDHMMPEMNGIEAAQIIRNGIGSEYAKTVPIIALTANAIRGSEEMFLKSGFQDFLSKPIDLKRMDAVIRRWVRDKEQDRLNNNSDSVAWEQGHRSGEIDGIDFDKAMSQFNNDEETLKHVLKYYIEKTPVLLDSIRTVDPDNLSAYAIVVHGIKGSSRSIYAGKAGDMAEELEQAGKAGDYSFVKNNNDALIAEVEKLIASIEAYLTT